MKFNQALKKAREKAGLSQKQLADMLNVPASMISRYESTDTEPRISFALKVIETLKITPNAFFKYDEIETTPLTEKLANLRKTAGLSVLELSEKLNISEKKYNSFEKGLKLPSLATLNDIFMLCENEPFTHSKAYHIKPLIYDSLFYVNYNLNPFAKMDINEDTNKLFFSYPNLGIFLEIEPEKIDKICDIAEEKTTIILMDIHDELFKQEIVKAIISLNSK